MRQILTIPVKRCPCSDDLPLPAYKTEGAAGMDLCAAVSEPVLLAPGRVVAIPCGFALAIPLGFEGQVRPRSGLAMQYAITVANSPGTIDSDYRGEVKVLLLNQGKEPFQVRRGMRIAQLVIAPVQQSQWAEVDDLPPTGRGEGGFGHTGHAARD